MAKRNRQKRKATQVPFDPEMAARWAEILRLREKAKRELGPKYSLKAFDDAVVKGGNVPMDVLAKNIDEYIARTKST